MNISYVLPRAGMDNGDRSLIVELVPDVPPNNWPWVIEAPGSRRLTFLCRIHGQAPGLMSRLTVDTFADHVREASADNSTERGYYWKRGVFLREASTGNEALLELVDRGSDTLRVDVRGPVPEGLFWRLHGTVREAARFWPGLADRIEFKVPCPMSRELSNPCKGEFDIDGLVNLQRRKPGDLFKGCTK